MLLFGQEFVDLGLVESHQNVPADVEYRDGHLVRLLNHLFGLVPVTGDVIVGVGYSLSRKILFRPLAEGSGGGAVDDYLFVRHSFTSLPAPGRQTSGRMPEPSSVSLHLFYHVCLRDAV